MKKSADKYRSINFCNLCVHLDLYSTSISHFLFGADITCLCLAYSSSHVRESFEIVHDKFDDSSQSIR